MPCVQVNVLDEAQLGEVRVNELGLAVLRLLSTAPGPQAADLRARFADQDITGLEHLEIWANFHKLQISSEQSTSSL